VTGIKISQIIAGGGALAALFSGGALGTLGRRIVAAPRKFLDLLRAYPEAAVLVLAPTALSVAAPGVSGRVKRAIKRDFGVRL